MSNSVAFSTCTICFPFGKKSSMKMLYKPQNATSIVDRLLPTFQLCCQMDNWSETIYFLQCQLEREHRDEWRDLYALGCHLLHHGVKKRIGVLLGLRIWEHLGGSQALLLWIEILLWINMFALKNKQESSGVLPRGQEKINVLLGGLGLIP